MAEVPRIVVDSSVATKWHLQDEELVESAQRVFADFLHGRLRLIAPEQLRSEVASSLLQATRPQSNRPTRLRRELARQSLQDFLNIGIEFISHDHLIVTAFDLAAHFGCSYYDALYLSVAELTQTPFVYADSRLRNALANRFPLATWIEDYGRPSK